MKFSQDRINDMYMLYVYIQHELHTGWDDVLRWGLRMWAMKTLKATLFRLGWNATIYNVWKQRNNIRHGNQIITEEKIVVQIITKENFCCCRPGLLSVY